MGNTFMSRCEHDQRTDTGQENSMVRSFIVEHNPLTTNFCFYFKKMKNGCSSLVYLQFCQGGGLAISCLHPVVIIYHLDYYLGITKNEVIAPEAGKV